KGFYVIVESCFDVLGGKHLILRVYELAVVLLSEPPLSYLRPFLIEPVARDSWTAVCGHPHTLPVGSAFRPFMKEEAAFAERSTEQDNAPTAYGQHRSDRVIEIIGDARRFVYNQESHTAKAANGLFLARQTDNA